ncbi:NADP-dependent oxidoreductase [Achromobacter sp. GG226]|uniref:NADP-dependent oxidoreductase n=1 Tax=Verticiella alkaliphila TaxID=2779529 RepID=UPI001C0CEB49|nr:NADP-dependent oxidoreductase [Verticiella sp. GG226]MBU4610175.1 NADP-dependent oxidoreductase [Verticiella sp. GG226]
MTTRNRRIVLASRPDGAVTPDNFRFETVDVPEPAEGQVLVRVHYLSLDPYMRGRMNDGRSYANPQALDETMVGGTVGEVIASRDPGFAVGDKVVGNLGWQEYGVADAKILQKVDDSRVPLSAFLGPAGMPGVTAWYGYRKIIAPKAGETVVVSAASGAVGSVVGQLAKADGMRAVGIAGGPEKCDYVVRELGFDACVDYKAAQTPKELARLIKEATPDGVDGYFENVGGDILNTVLGRLNTFARVAVCGLISDYNNKPGEAAKSAIQNPVMFLVARFRMEGFIVSDHLDIWPEAVRELTGLLAEGRLKYRESIAEGLDATPEAFIGLLAGRNFGKQLVRLV